MTNDKQNEIESLRQSGLVDEKWYLEEYRDVKAIGMDPVEHYHWIGRILNRKPSENPGYINKVLFRDEISSFKSEINLNSSTYNKARPYNFLSPVELDIIAKNYIKRKSTANIAIFSCITGDYDDLMYHENLMSNADYLLFSDDFHEEYIYKCINAPYHDEDPVRRARYVKTHPHTLLHGYDVGVWVDGNILIRGDLTPVVEDFLSSNMPVAAIPHPLRQSVYDEANECINRNKDDPETIRAQMGRYHAEGFDTLKLIESNFMMFRLKHPELSPIMDAWWAEIDSGSRRDQLSFNYAMEKIGAKYFSLTTRPNSVRNHPALALFHHGSNIDVQSPTISTPPRSVSAYADVMEARVAAQARRSADVVVCVHNALEVVEPCLVSVAAHRNKAFHRIVIVDDGSLPEARDWLANFAAQTENVHLIRRDQGSGYTKAANAGLRAATADFVILLNSDTLVAGHWIEKMMDAAYSYPGVGIVGPLSSAASHQSIPDHRSTAGQTAINDMPPGYTVTDMNTWCEVNSPADFLPRVPLVHGFCFGLTRDAINKIGYFDEENFPFGYGEENDYCLRARDAGVSLVVATHTYVYHKKSQSYTNNDKRKSLMQAGNKKIRDLHGKDRVLRSVRIAQDNPHLVRMRSLSEKLFL